MNENTSLSEYENRREDRLKKFFDHLDPEVKAPLSPADAHYFKLMHKSFHLHHKFFSPSDVHKMLMEEEKYNGGKYSSSMAYQILADAAHIFGKTRDLDKEAVRKILIEHYFKSNQMAIQDKDASGIEKAELIAKNADRIAKLYGLYSKDMEFDPSMLMGNATFVFQNQGDIEVNATKNEQNNA